MVKPAFQAARQKARLRLAPATYKGLAARRKRRRLAEAARQEP